MSPSSRLSYVAHGFPPAPTTSLAPGYTFRFPPTLGHGGQDAGPNVVVYVVPALFAFGLVVAFGWWYYLRRARRSRANAFDHKVTLDAEVPRPRPLRSISFMKPIPSSCSLATVLEKSFEVPSATTSFPPPPSPLRRGQEEDSFFSPPPPVYSPGWGNVGPAGTGQ
ncbi:hypothetical protein JCM3766R1_004456 [Sporobolomyces carnicolor]